ncbi:MAG: metallophosphoesterase [Lachnospiraceae bacterium]
MFMVYFTADTHFSDENIILYENRPFENAVKMDKELILKWNGIVSNNDTVYILGDFGAQGSESLLLSQLKGEKYLVKGNHDSNTNAYYREAGFKEVYDFPIITREFWILSHEPLYVNENMPYANIFGHVHNSPLYKTYSRHHYCVSVERTNYAPISFDEIISKITGI